MIFFNFTYIAVQSLADELYKEDFNKLLMRSVFEFGGSPFFKVIVWPNSVISVSISVHFK